MKQFIYFACVGELGTEIFQQVKFTTSLPISVKKCHWNFDGDYTESVHQFDTIAMFTILILSINEHGSSIFLESPSGF